MDLLTPEAQEGAHYWASVLLAHMAIGGALAGAGAALGLGWLRAAAGLAVAYGGLWEGLAQRLGAGLVDAAVDTAAVTGGALIAWGIWAHRARVILPPALVLSAVLTLGIWRRRDRDQS